MKGTTRLSSSPLNTTSENINSDNESIMLENEPSQSPENEKNQNKNEQTPVKASKEDANANNREVDKFHLNTDNSTTIGENDVNQISKLTASSSYEVSTPSSYRNLISSELISPSSFGKYFDSKDTAREKEKEEENGSSQKRSPLDHDVLPAWDLISDINFLISPFKAGDATATATAIAIAAASNKYTTSVNSDCVSNLLYQPLLASPPDTPSILNFNTNLSNSSSATKGSSVTNSFHKSFCIEETDFPSLVAEDSCNYSYSNDKNNYHSVSAGTHVDYEEWTTIPYFRDHMSLMQIDSTQITTIESSFKEEEDVMSLKTPPIKNNDEPQSRIAIVTKSTSSKKQIEKSATPSSHSPTQLPNNDLITTRNSRNKKNTSNVTTTKKKKKSNKKKKKRAADAQWQMDEEEYIEEDDDDDYKPPKITVKLQKSSSLPPPPAQLSMNNNNNNNNKKSEFKESLFDGCRCSKSRCLKLYCECFQLKATCNPNVCKCTRCLNTPSNRDTLVKDAIEKIEARRGPNAFGKRLKRTIHDGCSCKKNRCLKKYCNCFNLGIKCDIERCSCNNCKNMGTDIVDYNKSYNEDGEIDDDDYNVNDAATETKRVSRSSLHDAKITISSIDSFINAKNTASV